MNSDWSLVAASGVFDRLWYVAQYPDVAEVGIDPLVHFMCQGWRERRDPGPLFSTAYYVDDNPDVSDADINPLVHYLRWGWREDRRPLEGCESPDGSEFAYGSQYSVCPLTLRLAKESALKTASNV